MSNNLKQALMLTWKSRRSLPTFPENLKVLKRLMEWNDKLHFAHVSDGVITSMRTNEVLDPNHVRTSSLMSGLAEVSEATCGGSCSVGKPKQACLDEGIYKPGSCAMYIVRPVDMLNEVPVDFLLSEFESQGD